MRGHQHIDGRLQIRCRRFPCQAVVTGCLVNGGYPHRIYLLTLDIELDVLVLVNTHIDIDIFFAQTRILGYTVHRTHLLVLIRIAGINHIILVSDRQRRNDFGCVGAIPLCIEVVHCQFRNRIHEGSGRKALNRIDIFIY